jgi:LCP family protein required for cell wall assembly
LWLSLVLVVTFLITGVIVSSFAFLSLDAYLNRPLNPLAEAAEAVSDLELPPLSQDGVALVPSLAPNEVAPEAIPTSETQGEESERTNVLVMGIDRRPGEAFISRTDTMMLMSIDPEKDTASILSIPRDLYVVLPGRGRDRINTAFVYGSAGNNPAAGAQLAMQTVEYNLGVPVDHYLMVDFSAVTRGVDALGGIDVNVPYNINDPTFLSLDQLIRLAKAATDVPSENIRNEVLDQNYVSSYRTELGASVLVPINEQISPLVQSMFYEN